MSQQFGAFTASELYCPQCGSAQPVRERLLLVLPAGELHEFVCSRCSSSLGKRTVTGPALAAAVPRAPVSATPSRRLLLR
jgi:DNA-directed RNA polymerase subunit RPC12/RpoP